ncbi:TPA: class I SAM-dependent methyltransferase [Candidatus Woesearchaeota archaeon]|nr:class I SAM-dependent methyltransferase [Candidatus Woesearchaeota archaeon]
MKCQICGSEETHRFLSLGHQPPSDSFVTKEQLNEPETYYPLDVYYCAGCHLVQLGYAVDPEAMFRDYLYTTGANNSLKASFANLTKHLAERFNLGQKDLAVDIGSNDGTLLEGYLPYKIKVLGVEPSTIAEIAKQKGIPTANEFFNEETALKLARENDNAKVITATNVFAHIKDVHSVVRGVKTLLAEGGAFVTESHHLLSMVTQMQYDSIYHEHLRYYSLKPLIHLFGKHGMEVFDAELITTHGGSIRVYACKKGDHPVSGNVATIISKEEKAGLYTSGAYDQFAKKVTEAKFKLQELLRDAKKKGRRIVGVGAPAKGSTLLNYCSITRDELDYTVEKSPLKIGRFTPGTHIPIVEEARMLRDQPEYALILSWNIKDEIIPKLRAAGYKGEFIIPCPEPHVD